MDRRGREGKGEGGEQTSDWRASLTHQRLQLQRKERQGASYRGKQRASAPGLRIFTWEASPHHSTAALKNAAVRT